MPDNKNGKKIYRLLFEYMKRSGIYKSLIEKIYKLKGKGIFGQNEATRDIWSTIMSYCLTDQISTLFDKVKEDVSDDESVFLQRYLLFFGEAFLDGRFEENWEGINEFLEQANSRNEQDEWRRRSAFGSTIGFAKIDHNDNKQINIQLGKYHDLYKIPIDAEESMEYPYNSLGRYLCYIDLTAGKNQIRDDLDEFLKEEWSREKISTGYCPVTLNKQGVSFEAVARYLDIYDMKSARNSNRKIAEKHFSHFFENESLDNKLPDITKITPRIREEKKKAEKIIEGLEMGVFPLVN